MFVKGQSGNPHGRPRGLPVKFRDEQGRKSIDKLIEIRDDPDADQRDQIAAAKIVLAYTWGQPEQNLTIGGGDSGPLRINVTIAGVGTAAQEKKSG